MSRPATTSSWHGRRPCRRLHNIPEGLAVAGPVYAATARAAKRCWAGLSGMAEILGGVLAWLILGAWSRRW